MMNPKLFDIHSHLNFHQFNKDRDEMIGVMRKNGIWTICVGVDEKTSRECLELAESSGVDGGIFAAVGKHPTESGEDFNAGYFSALAAHPEVVAIGECGLDMFRQEKKDLERQKRIFEKQIDLALELDKPLIVHCRDSHQETIKILSARAGQGLKGDIHFFSGNWKEAQKYLDLGFSISFAGPITFTNEYDEVIKKTPLERIMAETDSPFAPPVPHRGKRNEPLFVEEIVKKIAFVRGISFTEAAEATSANALKLFFKNAIN